MSLTRYAEASIFLVRVALGWIFLYSGASKIISGTWSAAGYLSSAKTFPAFFAWFARPENIDWVTMLNEWGMLLIGISLILGAFVRYSAIFGALLMALYYLPALNFPYASDHFYLVDDHVIYFLTFLILSGIHAGEFLGFDKWLSRTR